jgi:menaquinol-cytochrome c reductase iron-sulfur subunit
MSISAKSNQVSRRDFYKIVTALMGTFIGTVIGVPAIVYLISPGLRVKETEAWVPLGPLSKYPIGVPKLFNFTRSQINGWEKTVISYGIFVIRKDKNQIRVLSNICTHLGCRVSWHSDIQHYVSPCHNGHFDIIGNVVSGPPPRPLDEFITKIEDGNLYIQYPPFRRS